MWIQLLLSLFVLAKGAPESPHDCQVLDQTSQSVTVECQPGYNGSLPQIFHMEIFSSIDEHMADNLTRLDKPSFHVTDLSPDTPYVLVIYASNIEGRSKPVALVATTLSRTDIAGEIECDQSYDQCDRPTFFEEIPQEMDVFKALCPELSSHMKCVRDFDMKCLEEGERRYSTPEKYADLIAFYEEICTEGTTQNEVATTKLKCFNETFSNTNCKQEMNAFLKPYEKEVPLDEFTTTHVIPERVHCLSQILLVNCLVDDIRKSCGPRAVVLAVEFLVRSSYVEGTCPLHYRKGLVEDIDEFHLPELQKIKAVNILLYLDEVGSIQA